MNQDQLNRAVASVTGESLPEIRHRGFGIADPLRVAFDPEPELTSPRTVDWDDLEAARLTLFP